MKNPTAPAKLTPPRSQLFWGLFLLIGMATLGAGCWNLFESLRCRSWPVTTGVITAAEMTTQSGDQGGETHGVNIAYDYMVAGQHYDGTRLAFGVMTASGGYAQAVLKCYPVGRKIPVHYSPADPQQAVLETGIHGGTGICLFIGILFVLAAWMSLHPFPAGSPPQYGNSPDRWRSDRPPPAQLDR